MSLGESLEVVAIIPVRGKDAELDGAPVLVAGKALIAYTIEAAMNSSVVSRTIVTTDSATVRQLASELGAETPFLRPPELAMADVTLDRVFQHCLEWLAEHEGYNPDIVLLMETSHPIRPPGLIDQVVSVLIEQRLDTMFTVYEERHAFWQKDEYGELSPVGHEESTPRSLRRPLYREMAGLALACRASMLLKDGRRFGNKLGVVPLHEPYALVDTQDPMGLVFAEHLLRQG